MPFREYTFAGHQVYSFNNVEEFIRLRYGAKALRQFDSEKWWDPYPQKRRRVRHITAYNLNHAK